MVLVRIILRGRGRARVRLRGYHATRAARGFPGTPDLGREILLDGVGDRAHGPALVKRFVVRLEVRPAEVTGRVLEHLLALERDRRA